MPSYGYRTKYRTGNVGYQVYGSHLIRNQSGSSKLNGSSGMNSNSGPTVVEVGDLILAPTKLWITQNDALLATLVGTLPESHVVKFVFTDEEGIPREEKELSNIDAFIDLFCIEDLEGFLSLTTEDYIASISYARIWDRKGKSHPGFVEYDYIIKHSVRPSGGGSSGCLGSLLEAKPIRMFLVNWRGNELLSVIPGVVELRARQDWLPIDTINQVYKDRSMWEKRGLGGPQELLRQEIEIPVVGMVGVLLEKKLVEHSWDEYHNVVAGTEEKSYFYKILFRDRLPMWVQGPIWKCPRELTLPIYLPVL